MQGYVTLATGSRLYIEQALNLALSLRLNDASRPVCLVTDDPDAVPGSYRPFIDEIRRLPPQDGFHGCLNKLRLQPISPFEESMFIDADCILMKPDMERHWSKLSRSGSFGIAADKRASGSWYGFDIGHVTQQLDIEYMGVMNSGLFYFRSDADGAAFFETTLAMVESHREVLGVFHRNRLQLADEPFIGAAIGRHRIEPAAYVPAEGSVMITTVRSSEAAFDPFEGTSAITKEGDFRLAGRFLPRQRVRHSPSVAHFVKLRPRRLYQRLSDKLRLHFGVEPYRF